MPLTITRRVFGAVMFSHEAVNKDLEEIEKLRAMTFEERGELLSLACRAAMKLLEGRRRSGLPDPEPAPWPESTWEFQRKHAASARRAASS